MAELMGSKAKVQKVTKAKAKQKVGSSKGV